MLLFRNSQGGAALLQRFSTIAFAFVLTALATGCDTPENDVTAPKIVAGAAHACAFDADREQVVCWGDNSYGQLGNEEFSAEGVSAPVRVKVISGRKIKSLSAGYSHTCALVSGGDDNSKNTVACWGYNHYGQVGNGSFNDSNVPVFVNGPDGNPLTGVVNVSAGAYHTCASIVKGSPSDPSNYIATTYCWGRNDKGQIGNDALTNVNVPTEIKGLDYSSGVAAGTAHTCALTSKSTDDAQAKKYVVMCWGDASRGQMRDAKVELGYTTTPVDIGLPLQGDDNGFPALFSEHVVQADVTTATGKPVEGEAALAAAAETPAYGQTCAISADQVQCWGGTNQNGQWGTYEKGVTDYTVKTEEIVSGSKLKAYGAGNAQSCMLVGKGDDSSANEVACWGYSSSLGFAMSDDTADAVVATNRTPVTLQGQRPTGLAVGREFVCYAAKGEQPQIWCWGTGKKGQIGNATTESTRVPVCVKGYCPDTNKGENLVEGQPFDEAPKPPPTILQVSAGFNRTCAVAAGGKVYCWGASPVDTFEYDDDYGMGVEARANPLPQEVEGLDGVALSVSTGQYLTCAVMVGGKVTCWGLPYRGPRLLMGSLQGGKVGSFLTPFVPPGFEAGMKAVTVGEAEVCAIDSKNNLHCYDALSKAASSEGTAKSVIVGGGMLLDLPCVVRGDGKSVVCGKESWYSYVSFAGENYTSISGTDVHHCAVLTDGRVRCGGELYDSEEYLPGVNDAIQVAVRSQEICVLRKTGGVTCIRQAGGLVVDEGPYEPFGLQFGVLAITAGSSHTCALVIGGVVKCWGLWGNNKFGQLGDGTTNDAAIPVEVAFGAKTRGEATVKMTNAVEGQRQQKATLTLGTAAGDLAYGFDCDNDGTFEIQGKVAGHECFYDKLASGSYDVGYEVTAKGLFGDVKTSGKVSFTVQNSPPVITAVNHDATVIAAGSNAAKTFTITAVTASDPGGDALTYAYDCNRDGAITDAEKQTSTNAVCDLSGLTPGTYSLPVFVTDADHATQGNGQTIKPITITITSPAEAQIDSAPPEYSGAALATFTFSSPQTDTIEYKLDNAAFAVTTTGTASFTALTDGTHTFYARAVSGGFAGAVTSYTWIVDTVAPVTVSDTTFLQPLGVASVQINFHATDANAAAGFTYQCRLDAYAATSCASGDTFGPVITEGTHAVVVTAYDAAGNPATSTATVAWSYYIPPVTTLDTSGPTQGATISSNTASFTFTSPTATSFECSLDGGAWTTCTSPADYTGLPDGSHSFAVRPVRNGVPGTPSATRTWTVDTTPPATTITASQANDAEGASYSVEFTCGEAGCSFECKLDTGSFATCTSPYTATVASAGQHTIEVRAYDALGNVDATPATATWNATVGGGGGGGASVVTGATISAGASHVCSVSSGAMYCWGFAGPHLGELVGPPEFNGAYLPTQMGSLTDWVSVSASGSSSHTCGIRASGALYCWGGNSSGQLGDPAADPYAGSAAPVQVAPGQTWHKVAAIDQHTCAIRSDQSLWCWGANGSGELGLGFVGDFVIGYSVTVPTQVGTATNWIDVGGGYASTCALNANSDMYCWGMNSMGQLGVGTMDSFSAPLTAAATDVKAMTAGGEYACAVYNDGSLWCWGDNNVSQGGNAASDRTLPSQVGTATDWATVEAGITHSCAIKTNGTRWCWGDWANNALGDDSALSGTQTTPYQVGSETDWLELSCSQQYCVGVRNTAGKDVFSWGYNQFNRAGVDSDVTPVVSPMQQLTPY